MAWEAAGADHVLVTSRAVVRPNSLVTLLVLAALFPAWTLLRGLYLSLPFGHSDVDRYAAEVGHNLVPAAVVATLVLVAVAVGVGWIRPDPSEVLTAGVAVTVSVVLGLTGLAWVAADKAMHPFGPELRAVAAFVAPEGAEAGGESTRASENPEVTRYWYVPGTTASVCPAAVRQFQAWADPATVVDERPRNARSCHLRALRAGRPAELRVSGPFPDRPGRVLLAVEVRRR